MQLVRALGWRMGAIVTAVGAVLLGLTLRSLLDATDRLALRGAAVLAALFMVVLGIALVWELVETTD